MASNNFLGTWKLISLECRSLGNKVLYHPFGKHPVGYITYNENGYMFATIRRDKLSDIYIQELVEARQDFLKPWLFSVNTRQYLKSTFRYFQGFINYVSYSGRYEVYREKVIHYVESSFFPNLNGRKLERTFKFINNGLLLVAPSFTGMPYYLHWERSNQALSNQLT